MSVTHDAVNSCSDVHFNLCKERIHHHHSNAAGAGSGFFHVSGFSCRDNVLRHEGLPSILRNLARTNWELIMFPQAKTAKSNSPMVMLVVPPGATMMMPARPCQAGMRVCAERMLMRVLQEGAVGKRCGQLLKTRGPPELFG